MTIDVVVPKWGLTSDEVILVEWLCRVGDVVVEDQALASIETDKAAGELPSPADGEIVEIIANAGDELAPGQVVARIRLT
jgi:pyruvate/2-oxoglutarate dehydrogenase complex dihydrolipoamide acyltransferase (E2) component